MAIEVCTCSEDPCAHSLAPPDGVTVHVRPERGELPSFLACDPRSLPEQPPPSGHFRLTFEIDFGTWPIELNFMIPMGPPAPDLRRVFADALSAIERELDAARGAKS